MYLLCVSCALGVVYTVPLPAHEKHVYGFNRVGTYSAWGKVTTPLIFFLFLSQANLLGE